MTEGPSDKQGAEVIPLPKRRPGGPGGGKGRGERCPICGKGSSPEHRPFCSARCAEIDLGRWLKGGYRVPTEEAPGEDDAIGSGGGDPGRDDPGRNDPGRKNREPE